MTANATTASRARREKELTRLRREIRTLREEREILKKPRPGSLGRRSRPRGILRPVGPEVSASRRGALALRRLRPGSPGRPRCRTSPTTSRINDVRAAATPVRSTPEGQGRRRVPMSGAVRDSRIGLVPLKGKCRRQGQRRRGYVRQPLSWVTQSGIRHPFPPPEREVPRCSGVAIPTARDVERNSEPDTSSYSASLQSARTTGVA